ncbi:phage integrase family protein [Vibrio crassostreae]|uniref:site-specific integrase n=1 Tax=Vibrio TaxID=662 RepID=UPI00119BAA62|nr:site-specific integrase [Vibrio crassostreae]TWD39682.1 phage integrase family protein [Vibrio crassostreae]
MEYKIEILILSDGERFPILVGSDGMPHFYATLWVTTKLRSDKAVNTIKNHLTDLKCLFKWEEEEGRDLYSEFQQGKFLDEKEIEKVKTHLSLNVAFIKGIAKKSTRNKVISIDDAPALIKTVPKVSRNHHYNKMTSVAEYLDFIAKLAVRHQNSDKLNRSVTAMTKKIKAFRPKGRGHNVLEPHDELTLPDGIVEEFLEVAHYDNPLNPFKNDMVKRRNHLMFVLLKELGIRRGELLSLSMTHMSLVGDKPFLWVRREHDSKDDPRKNQPVTKTKERKLRIKKQTAVLIDEYILKYRRLTPNANKHPFLFITHRKGATQGQPLSASTFDTIIIPTMKAVDPKFAYIHAHYFRHDWNEGYSKKIDAINALVDEGSAGHQRIDPVKEAKMRQHHLGHSNEKSAAVYNKRHIKKRAEEVSLEEQESLEMKLKKLKEANSHE